MSTTKNPTCCGTAMNSFIRFDAAIIWQCHKCHCILTQAGEKYRPWKKDEVPTACIMKPDCGSGSKFNISPTDEEKWGSFDVCHIEDRGSIPTVNILKFFTMMDGSPCGVKITSETKETDVKSKSSAKKSTKDEHIGELTASLKIVTRQREEALRSLEKVEQVLAEEQARTDRLQREAVSQRRDLEEMTKNRDCFHQKYRNQMATITQMQKQESSFAAQKGALEDENTGLRYRLNVVNAKLDNEKRYVDHVEGEQFQAGDTLLRGENADLKAKNREIEARLGQTRATLLGQLRGMEKTLFDCTRATPVKPIMNDCGIKMTNGGNGSNAQCDNNGNPVVNKESYPKGIMDIKPQHPFSGKAKCKKCGFPMSWVSPGKWHCDNTACSSHVGKCFRCGVTIGEKANLQYKVVDGNAYCAHCMSLKYGKVIPLTYPTENSKASDKEQISCALCGSSNHYTVLDGRVVCSCCLPYPLNGEGKSFEEARAELQNNINVAKAKEEKPAQPLPTAQVWTASDGPLQYRPWRMGEIPKMFYATPSGGHSGYASWWYKYDDEAWTEDMGRTTIVKLRSNKKGDITISTEELLKHFHGEASNPILGVKLEVKPTDPPKEAKPTKEAVIYQYAANRDAIKKITNKTAMALDGAVISHAIRDNSSAKAYYVKQCRDWAKRNHKSFEKVFGAALDGIA